MRSAFPTMLAIALLIAFPFSSAFAQQTPPDLILFNGRVFTSNASRPYFEALAIRGEHIFAVGTSKEIAILAGKETHGNDLGGHTVIPGINDAHHHLVVGPKSIRAQFRIAQVVRDHRQAYGARRTRRRRS